MSDDDQIAQVRALATHIADQNADHIRALTDEHTASFRWMMASLLALNGAGLLSLKDIRMSDPTFAIVAAVSFFLGLGCALSIAYIGQKANQMMLTPVARLGLYWRSVALTGELDDAVQNEQNDLMDAATKLGRWPSRMGMLSFTSFAFGLLMLGLGWEFSVPVTK